MLSLSHSRNVYNDLKNRELGASKFDGTYIENLFIKNIKEDNYTTTIFNGHNSPVINFDVKDFFAATLSLDNNIRLWNLETGKCLWSTMHQLMFNEFGLIKIVEDKIVFSGTSYVNSQPKNVFKIVGLISGNETAQIKENMIMGTACMVGKKIFGLIDNFSIGEWNLDGEFIQRVDIEKAQLEKAQQNYSLTNLNNFLVYRSGNFVVLYDPAKNKSREFTFPNFTGSRISCLHLDENYLIAGYSVVINRDIFLCIVDLNTEKQFEIRIEIKATPESSGYFHSINNIVANQNKILLAHSSGNIIIYNFEDNSLSILGKHLTPVKELVLEGPILFTRSSSYFGDPGEIKLWDISTMKLLSAQKCVGNNKVQFTSQKIFTTTENSFMQKNYLVSHKGVTLSEETLKVEYISEETDECWIQ
ncbi:MAG TPA: WD40 repeat domain-containing protein [Parachlamydiaceae bacterium]|nr:WD40 repeat domain-containing protein [Parachlamydiaceae bacterium]